MLIKTYLKEFQKLKKTVADAVIVKYNPCTVYARGSTCPQFYFGRRCNKLPLTCEMPEYDKWYKDVLKGNVKSFFPSKILLLERPGTLLLLYHVDYHAIVGEARIERATIQNNQHFYWFDNFNKYENPVQLEILESDIRLPRIAKRSRTRFVYIDKATIEEIRDLSRLSVNERLRIGKDFEKASQLKLKKPQNSELDQSRRVFNLDNEFEQLKTHKIPDEVLKLAEKHFLSSLNSKTISKKYHYDLFYASLYFAIREVRFPMAINEISKISRIREKNLGKTYRLLVKQFGLTTRPASASAFIKFRSNDIGLSKQEELMAIDLFEQIKTNKKLQGKKPSVIAAFTVFMITRETRKKNLIRKIAKGFGVTKEAIMTLYSSLSITT